MNKIVFTTKEKHQDMKKYQIFSIIFATVFVATTTLLISSCSQDDDYYDTDMHTLAEKRMTRSGEPQPAFEGLGAGTGEYTFHMVGSDFNVTFDLSWQQFIKKEDATASITVKNVNNNSNLLPYTDSLGIERTIRRYDYIDCEIEARAQYHNGYFKSNSVYLYYRKAHEEYGVADGTYDEPFMEAISISYLIPNEYILK